MEKPFEVGEWVWYWGTYSRAGWYQIKKVNGDLVWFDSECSGRVYAAAENFTRNPVIPPKPKKIVTKEAEWTSDEFMWSPPLNEFHIPRMGMLKTYVFPPNATNIKPPTYDIEE